MSVLFGLAAGIGIMGLSAVKRTGTRWIDRRIARGSMPRLYPELSDAALCQVFDANEAKALHADPPVYVAALHGADESSASIGRAFSQLLRRDLMLVRGLSAQGSEDTPSDAFTGPDAIGDLSERNDWFVGGEARANHGKLQVSIWAARRDERHAPLTCESDDPSALLREVVLHVAKKLGGRMTPLSEEGLRHGRPASLETLRRAGDILNASLQRRARGTSSDDDLEIEARALDLLGDEPQLSILAPCLSNERLGDTLKLYQHDPFNAALCFSLSAKVWRDRGFERDAAQFVRRGLELCPSHGKLNMIAPLSAFDPSTMGHHAELGYLKLPGNSFAAGNYAYWLTTHARDHRRVIEIARAAIDLSPADPANYEHLIGAYEALSDFERALEVARELLGWFEPKLHPRTRYCLYQNPVMKQRIESGQHDPAESLRSHIRALEQRAKPQA